MKKTTQQFSNWLNSQIVTKWSNLDQDSLLVDTLFELEYFDEVEYLICKQKVRNWKFKSSYFTKVIQKGQLQLIVFFLRFRECRVVLDKKEVQKLILEEYVKKGERIYYAAEMLSYIYKTNWNNELTKELARSAVKVVKTKSIQNCHAPVLSCLLIAEFLMKIRYNHYRHFGRCTKGAESLQQFCNHVHKVNPEESYIKYLMDQRDSRGRNSFQVASENRFYTVLESSEVGTLVGKMWNGKVNQNGFSAASSLARFLNAQSYTAEPFNNFEHLDQNKIYISQMEVWTGSCALRYWPEIAYTTFMILIFNAFLYSVVRREESELAFSDFDSDLQALLTVHLTMCCSMLLSSVNQVIFSRLAGRDSMLNSWVLSELLLLLFSLAILVSPSDVESFVPSKRLFRGILFSFVNLLVWLRITGILLTFKEIGPLLRMIYLMGKLVIRYLVIYGLFVLSSGAVFTAMFFDSSVQFTSFSISIIHLFGGFFSEFRLDSFSKNAVFGNILLMIFVTFSGIMMINLLIAILSNVYDTLSIKVDASHRSVLIEYYRRFKWDKQYGFMIFLTTPLNLLNWPIMLYRLTKGRLTVKENEEFNKKVTQFYYLIYFSFIALGFILFNSVLMPLVYLKGLFVLTRQIINLNIPPPQKLILLAKWVLGGIPFLLAVQIRDLLEMSKTIFKPLPEKTNDVERFMNYINQEDVRTFLRFIHSRKEKDSCDLHDLFFDYLNFEYSFLAQADDKTEKNLNYLKLVDKQTGKRKITVKQSQMRLFNNASEEFDLVNKFLKKNIIVIEVMENYLVRDSPTDTGFVNVDKMKMLLPKTVLIDSEYAKRMLYSDINSLSLAVNKMKQQKNIFIQFTLLTKAIKHYIRLDKEIDKEIAKTKRTFASEEHQEGNAYVPLKAIFAEIQRDLD